MPSSAGEPEIVVLRHDEDDTDLRHLAAYLDEAGDLHVDGQDLGPGTAPVSGDGEYEWFQVIRAAHVPALLAALGAAAGEPPLDVLRRFADGDGSYRLEAVLRSGIVPVERQVWSG